MDARLPLISIVLCTKGKLSDLYDCLVQLSRSNYRNYEIIVVSSNASIKTRMKIEELCRTLKVRCIYEPKQGLAVARNVGIKCSSGEIIVFIDDDCIPSEGWLELIADAFSDCKVHCVGGRVLSALKGLYMQYFETSLTQALKYNKDKLSINALVEDLALAIASKLTKVRKTRWELLPPLRGTILAFRGAVFERIGYFCDYLGLNAFGKAGEDTEMVLRVLLAGGEVLYKPEIIVHHFHRVGTLADVIDVAHKYAFARGVIASMLLRRITRLKEMVMLLVLFYHGVLQKVYNISIASLGAQSYNRILNLTELKGFVEGFFTTCFKTFCKVKSCTICMQECARK